MKNVLAILCGLFVCGAVTAQQIGGAGHDNGMYTEASYGELTDDTGTTLTITTAGTWYGWVSATASDVAGGNLMTADTSATAPCTGATDCDYLKVGTKGGGTYLMTLQFSFSGTGGAVVQCHVFENQSSVAELGFDRKLGVGGDIGSASMTGLIALDPNDILDVRCTSDDDADTIDIAHGQFTLTRITP